MLLIKKIIKYLFKNTNIKDNRYTQLREGSQKGNLRVITTEKPNIKPAPQKSK
jgi:hypothetical protein